MLLGLYFTGLGVLALAGLISPMIAPGFGRSAFWNKTHEFDLPVLGPVAFNKVDLLCVVACSSVGYMYYTTHLWWCNNLFGVSFSIRGIEMLSLGSFLNGVILLCGLFVYDVFWVFGTTSWSRLPSPSRHRSSWCFRAGGTSRRKSNFRCWVWATS